MIGKVVVRIERARFLRALLDQLGVGNLRFVIQQRREASVANRQRQLGQGILRVGSHGALRVGERPLAQFALLLRRTRVDHQLIVFLGDPAEQLGMVRSALLALKIRGQRRFCFQFRVQRVAFPQNRR
jgi:hypothetical protein